MSKITVTVLLLAGLAPCLSAQGFDGWGRVKWGATQTQVLDTYKAEGVKEVEVTVFEFKGAEIAIPEYKIGEDSFTVEFAFDRDGLKQVVLKPNIGDYLSGKVNADAAKKLGVSSRDIARINDNVTMSDLNQVAERVLELLEQKYGPPSKLEKSRMNGLGAEWYLDAGKIAVIAGRNPAWGTYEMRLVYFRKDKAVDKL